MKRCAALTVKSSSFKGEAISNVKTKRQKLIIGTTFLVCGFFYFLFNVFTAPLGENNSTLKAVPRNFVPSAIAKTEDAENLHSSSLCTTPFDIKNSRESQIEILPDFCQKDIFKSEEELLLEKKEEKEENTQQELLKILGGTPMEKMIDPILEQDKTVAAFLVGIAFKESKFGVYSPKKNGNDCFNYWGFKGKTNPNKSGYSCFSSPNEAVEKVGARLEKLSIDAGRTRPSQMTVWKCGSSCATHSPQSVQKWIADVAIFYDKVSALEI